MKTRRSARIKACSRDVIKAYLSLRAICLCKKEEHITLARQKNTKARILEFQEERLLSS